MTTRIKKDLALLRNMTTRQRVERRPPLQRRVTKRRRQQTTNNTARATEMAPSTVTTSTTAHVVIPSYLKAKPPSLETVLRALQDEKDEKRPPFAAPCRTSDRGDRGVVAIRDIPARSYLFEYPGYVVHGEEAIEQAEEECPSYGFVFHRRPTTTNGAAAEESLVDDDEASDVDDDDEEDDVFAIFPCVEEKQHPRTTTTSSLSSLSSSSSNKGKGALLRELDPKVDGAAYLAHLMNHIRGNEANVAPFQEWHGDRPHIYFYALRDIPKGHELLFDYGLSSPRDVRQHPWLETRTRPSGTTCLPDVDSSPGTFFDPGLTPASFSTTPSLSSLAEGNESKEERRSTPPSSAAIVGSSSKSTTKRRIVPTLVSPSS